MQAVRKGILWVVAAMSGITSVATFTEYARSASSWGLPLWAWGTIGLAVLFISLGMIVYGYWKRAKSLESQLQEVASGSKTILFVEIQHYGFGPLGPRDIGYPLGKENSLWIWLHYTALRSILVESIVLEVVDKRISSFNWESRTLIGSNILYVRFDILDWISPGKHEVQLMVFAEGREVGSVKRLIKFPNLVFKGD